MQTTKDFLWNVFGWELCYHLLIWKYWYWNFLSNINGGKFLLQNLSYWFWLFFLIGKMVLLIEKHGK